MSMLQVVSGLAVREGKILLGLRPAGKKRPSLWETPGGKVEVLETPEQALAREWREELGVDVHVGRPIASSGFALEVNFIVTLYAVRFEGEPRLLDHEKLIWHDALDAVEHLPCSPAYYAHFYRVKDWLRGLQDRCAALVRARTALAVVPASPGIRESLMRDVSLAEEEVEAWWL